MDGIVTSKKEKPKVLEVKCPRTFLKKDPNKFDGGVPKKKLNSQSCFLQRQGDGVILLKTEHPYYDQVQMQMGLMGFEKCDFFVWSPVNTLCIPVAFDIVRWNELKVKLTKFHWEVLVPDYFAKRTPRKLAPICLP